MDLITNALEWAKSHQALIWWTFGASLALLLLTPVAMGWAIVHLPTDYFTGKKRRPASVWAEHPALRPIYLVAKNLLGLVFVIAGIAMLVLPGQGLLAIVLGVILMNFPGKFRVERWLATRPPIWRSLNWLRRKARRPELERPHD